MGKVTSQTVTIKKSPVSTFGLSRTKSGSARIGDLNVVEHIMMEPADMVRCSVDTQILFISPLSVPAFARMKVFTYFFFDAYQNVFSDFNETIQNYTHEQKSELKNGTVVNHSNYTLPYVSLAELQLYVNCGLNWLPPSNPTVSTIPVPPFGDSNFYDDGFAVSMFNYKMQYDFCFSSYEQKINICKLANQFDVPYGLLQPLTKSFQSQLDLRFDALETAGTDNRRVNSISSTFDFNETTLKAKILELPFTRYWSQPSPNPQLSGLKETYQSLGSNSIGRINILPFKCYQHIFNDWFLNTQKNTPIDLFPDRISYQPVGGIFTRRGPCTATTPILDYTYYPSFLVCQFNCEANYYYNSIFQIRQPWYSKDYFNTSTNDPTLGVSPYAVGTSILDLRKNSALQRLAEKKALCGNKFVDFIVQHFNYYPPDLEIGRSIHLGTNVDYVNINTVLQTSESTSESPQGERAATAAAYGRSKGVFFKAPTYGEFMVLQCVKPEIDYYDGIPREMLITDVSDVPLPELSQIGFDRITQSEISVPMTAGSLINLHTAFNSTFGYTPRYSWRKTRLNRVYGELCNSLAFWHQSPSLRFGVTNDWKFGQLGFDTYNAHLNTLDRESGIVNPSYNRIFAITDVNDDTYVYQHSIKLSFRTALPTNDSPQL